MAALDLGVILHSNGKGYLSQINNHSNILVVDKRIQTYDCTPEDILTSFDIGTPSSLHALSMLNVARRLATVISVPFIAMYLPGQMLRKGE